MSVRRISQLRQRMIDDMTARQLGPQTERHIISAAASGLQPFSDARRRLPAPTTSAASSWIWPFLQWLEERLFELALGGFAVRGG
jgi:hypothetical protein